MTVLRQLYLDVDGNPTSPPKARSFKAIVRSIAAALSSKPHHTGRDAAARRAFQYAMAKHGVDTPHSLNLPYSIERACEFAKAPDGTNRVRAVDTDIARIEIPHWDFVPSIEVRHDVFA